MIIVFEFPLLNFIKINNHHYFIIFDSPGGYAACCYSYLWGKELEADVFSRFQKEGILNEKVGKEFRNKILECGNSKTPLELYRYFMGRNPDQTALLIREGIKSK